MSIHMAEKYDAKLKEKKGRVSTSTMTKFI